MVEYKVLIADDDEGIRKLAGEMVIRLAKKIGFEVDISLVNDRANLESACDESVDLVITDVDMGNGNDGFLATHYLRAKYPNLAIGVMSGHASEREAIEAGANYFVGKPFRLNDLKEKLLIPFYNSQDSLRHTT